MSTMSRSSFWSISVKFEYVFGMLNFLATDATSDGLISQAALMPAAFPNLWKPGICHFEAMYPQPIMPTVIFLNSFYLPT